MLLHAVWPKGQSDFFIVTRPVLGVSDMTGKDAQAVQPDQDNGLVCTPALQDSQTAIYVFRSDVDEFVFIRHLSSPHDVF
nr:hypothetical protein CFP56_10341 [Quercus suber]